MPKNKPRNDLTVTQELLIRDFLENCAEENLALAPEIIAKLIARLGYKIIAPGKLVRIDREIKFIYGDPDPFRNVDDEYAPDGAALRAEVAGEDTNPDEAGPSESPESDPVGGVLQQDV